MHVCVWVPQHDAPCVAAVSGLARAILKKEERNGVHHEEVDGCKEVQVVCKLHGVECR